VPMLPVDVSYDMLAGLTYTSDGLARTCAIGSRPKMSSATIGAIAVLREITTFLLPSPNNRSLISLKLCGILFQLAKGE
jgi:hypothetical protein